MSLKYVTEEGNSNGGLLPSQPACAAVWLATYDTGCRSGGTSDFITRLHVTETYPSSSPCKDGPNTKKSMT